MTADEAVALAKGLAAARGWPWVEPVQVSRSWKWLFFGPMSWHVWTNQVEPIAIASASEGRAEVPGERAAEGGHASVGIRDASGQPFYCTFHPR